MTVSARRAAALSDRARDRVPLQPAADGAPAEQERRGGPASHRPGDTRDEWGAASPVQPVVDPERETLPVCGDGHGGCRWPRPCPVVHVPRWRAVRDGHSDDRTQLDLGRWALTLPYMLSTTRRTIRRPDSRPTSRRSAKGFSPSHSGEWLCRQTGSSERASQLPKLAMTVQH